MVQSEESKIDRLLVTEEGLIHCFYYTEPSPPYSYPRYMYRKKPLGTSTWGDPKQIELNTIYENMYKIQIAKTVGSTGADTIHAFWIDHPGNETGFWQRKKNSSDLEWNIPQYLVSTPSVSFNDAAVTSASNDLFALWCFRGAAVIYHFRHYDDVPAAPKNLIITRSLNNHPFLSWSPNQDPDLDSYQIYRWDSYGGGWQLLNQTPNNSYEDESLTYCTAIPPAQCADLRYFQFYIKAIDKNSHISDPSNIVEARLVGGPPSKAVVNDPDGAMAFEYLLEQNYPNPFNPTTIINYSIKSAGDVSLKVYDILGTEVASLVNEVKEPGNYSVTFNAANLPSGIYVYILSTGNFIDTKKLILLK